MLLVPAALALALLSIACLLSAPIALAVAAAVAVWGAAADIEVAIVVSRRARTGARGQRVIASARTTPRRAVRAAAGWGVSTARAAAGAVAGARGAAARWAETEQAARWADRARTLADVGPAALTVGAVVALPWAMLAAPDGAGAAVGALAVGAVVHHLTAAAGARCRVDA